MTFSYMNLSNHIDINVSDFSIEEACKDEIGTLEYDNPSVLRLDRPEKGVYFFESKNPVDDEILILSAGIHGDELAGVKIIDDLRREILTGHLDLRKHICFIDGNLRAMQQAISGTVDGIIPPSRYWDADKTFGIEANANRMWKREYLQNTEDFGSYAGKRRVEIWKAINDILLGGTDRGIFTGNVSHTDIHQSFRVPTVREVRGSYINGSEYTYGMAYKSKTKNIIKETRRKYGDVYAGLVISDSEVAETFAAITAREFSALSVTAEIGTIGSPENLTYADKMFAGLRSELEGKPRALSDIPIDIWTQKRTIIREQEQGFGFYKDGKIITHPIPDFVPIKSDIDIQNDNDSFTIAKDTSLLFANRQVVLGDRAGVLIEKI